MAAERATRRVRREPPSAGGPAGDDRTAARELDGPGLTRAVSANAQRRLLLAGQRPERHGEGLRREPMQSNGYVAGLRGQQDSTRWHRDDSRAELGVNRDAVGASVAGGRRGPPPRAEGRNPVRRDLTGLGGGRELGRRIRG